jgi:hypothetical protein
MEKYLNVCTECRQKFVTEDDKQSFLDKDCVLCGSIKSIVSASKDMIFKTYVKRLMQGFGSTFMGINDEALRELEKDLDVFAEASDHYYKTEIGIVNKGVVVSDLGRVFDRKAYKSMNTDDFVKIRMNILIDLLDKSIKIRRKQRVKSIIDMTTIYY